MTEKKLGRLKRIRTIDEAPDGWRKIENVSEQWRSATLFTYGYGFDLTGWIKQPFRITIRPGETVKQAIDREWESFGQFLAGYKPSDIFAFEVNV